MIYSINENLMMPKSFGIIKMKDSPKDFADTAVEFVKEALHYDCLSTLYLPMMGRHDDIYKDIKDTHSEGKGYARFNFRIPYSQKYFKNNSYNDIWKYLGEALSSIGFKKGNKILLSKTFQMYKESSDREFIYGAYVMDDSEYSNVVCLTMQCFKNDSKGRKGLVESSDQELAEAQTIFESIEFV